MIFQNRGQQASSALAQLKPFLNWRFLSTTLPDLEILDLSFNSLEDLSALHFSDLRSLRWLSLNHNKRLVPVEKGSMVFSWDLFIHHPSFSMLRKDHKSDEVFLGLADTGMSYGELSLLIDSGVRVDLAASNFSGFVSSQERST